MTPRADLQVHSKGLSFQPEHRGAKEQENKSPTHIRLSRVVNLTRQQVYRSLSFSSSFFLPRAGAVKGEALTNLVHSRVIFFDIHSQTTTATTNQSVRAEIDWSEYRLKAFKRAQTEKEQSM